MNKVRMKHDDKMYFGKHTGTKLEEVPASYLLWLFEQPWLAEQHPELHEYIEYHYEEIEDREAEEDCNFRLFTDDIYNDDY